MCVQTWDIQSAIKTNFKAQQAFLCKYMYVAHNDETKPSIKGFFSVCQPNCNQKFKYFELLYTDFGK